MPNSLTIAVDFDGTIVENRFPEIGKPILFAFESLKKLQEEGHRLILWTYRCGIRLDEAVEFCEKNGLKFYAVNKSYPEEDFDDTISRKILADIFIDDRNLGGMKGWGEIFQMLSLEQPGRPKKKKKRSGLFGRL
ncbi:BT0820 family HAD-type phosphatase [Christiangramia sp. SM2212]|uniref:Hydrolase n=1 Tax=Christiangramia sediminicola TaxID=3073267 RepID=A0ABU1EMG1_9FLAO|nr:hydrolase [Christiangramia sp. SM2212]MDR5589582.1 hydrolase [Christiangramia sp. SM2212]